VVGDEDVFGDEGVAARPPHPDGEPGVLDGDLAHRHEDVADVGHVAVGVEERRHDPHQVEWRQPLAKGQEPLTV